VTAEVGLGRIPTTPGPTSNPALGPLTITATLTEHYQAVYRVPLTTPADSRRALMALAGYHAFQWLVDNDLDDGIELLTVDLPGHAGVSWEVPVGRGTAELSGDDALADVIDAKTDWTWSARWKHWAGWFGSMMAAEDAHRGYVPRPLHPVSALYEASATQLATQLASDGLWSEKVHDAVHTDDEDVPVKSCIEIPVSDEMYEPRAYPPD